MIARAITPGGARGAPCRPVTMSGQERQTCGKAIQLLEAEELLIRVLGFGYYVIKPAERPCWCCVTYSISSSRVYACAPAIQAPALKSSGDTSASRHARISFPTLSG